MTGYRLNASIPARCLQRDESSTSAPFDGRPSLAARRGGERRKAGVVFLFACHGDHLSLWITAKRRRGNATPTGVLKRENSE